MGRGYEPVKFITSVQFLCFQGKFCLFATSARWVVGNWRHLWGRTGQIVAIGYYDITTFDGYILRIDCNKQAEIQAMHCIQSSCHMGFLFFQEMLFLGQSFSHCPQPKHFSLAVNGFELAIKMFIIGTNIPKPLCPAVFGFFSKGLPDLI